MDTQAALVRQYEAAIKVDQAQVESSALQLAYAHIISPIAGRIGLRFVDQGNIVHASDANGLAVITQLQPITVLFSIPQDSVPKVMKQFHTGTPMVVEAFDRDGHSLLATGTLVTVDNQIDPTTGTVKLRAEFPNADETLFPNQFVNVQLIAEKIQGATVVPNAAVQRGTTGTFVYVVADQKTVSVRPVETGPSDKGAIVITKGLAAEEVVVVDGVDKLREGSTVELISRTEAASPGAKPGAKADKSCRQTSARRRPVPGRTKPPAARSRESLKTVYSAAGGDVVADGRHPARRAPSPTGLLPIAALPQVDYPTIQVVTLYPGASPEVITSSITAPLERQFGQMPGLNRMASTSSGGASMITLTFSLDLTLDVAEQEVQAAINAATNLLPTDLPTPPIYNKVNPADAPILTLGITSTTIPLPKVEDLVDTRLAQKLSQIPGVGLVSISGGQRPAVRVQADPRVPRPPTD